MPDGIGVVYVHTPSAPLTMSATGQFAVAPAFGLAIGKSPTFQSAGSRPADDVVVVSVRPEKNHSPRRRMLVAVGS